MSMNLPFQYIQNLELTEYSFAIKTICDHLDVTQDELAYFKMLNTLVEAEVEGKFARASKPISMAFTMPAHMLPKKQQDNKLFLNFKPSPSDGRYDRANVGIFECRLFDPDDESKAIQDKKHIKYWRWNSERDYATLNWVVCIKKQDIKKFYKFLIKIENEQFIKEAVPPILQSGMIAEIYKNTIGFLERGKELADKYKEYSIPFKRGILLCGKPGCGKTLTCKWLRALCYERDFSTKIITLETYSEARQHGAVRRLFQLPRESPGIIFFDDMDVMVKDRATGNLELQNFLTNLDGVMPTEGAVFVFTTNYIEELDEAFVRPGRIDLFLTYRVPGKRLRRRYVKTLFHDNIKKQIDVEDFIKRTDKYTFAEVEEVRKLMAMDIIDGKDVSMESTFKLFDKHRTEFTERGKFGFTQIDDDDDYDDYDDGMDVDDLLETLKIPKHRRAPSVARAGPPACEPKFDD